MGGSEVNELITIEGPGPLNPIGKPAIDWTKPVETKGSHKVHIYAIDHNLPQPVIGRIADDTETTQWSYDGLYYPDGRKSDLLDLRNVKDGK